jgi:hypothetical protein
VNVVEHSTVSRARVQGTDTYVAIKRMPLALQQSRPFDGVSALTPTLFFLFQPYSENLV